MLLLGDNGLKLYGISLNYFLKLHVDLQLYQNQSFKKLIQCNVFLHDDITWATEQAFNEDCDGQFMFCGFRVLN